MITPDTFYSVLRYSLDQFPFPALITELLGEKDLSMLPDDCTLRTRETDQQTKWHQRFYAAREVWGPLYINFVMGFVAQQLPEPFLFQAIPTFRVHLPWNLAVGDYHSDGDYGHPAGERNFWLPLTRASGTSSVYLEEGQDRRRSISAWPGDVVVFDAIATRHGNEINCERFSRVSFDFRVLPCRLYRETDARSVNMGKRFVPGEYYSDCVVTGRAWPMNLACA
jgi:hypothetical protein